MTHIDNSGMLVVPISHLRKYHRQSGNVGFLIWASKRKVADAFGALFCSCIARCEAEVVSCV